MTYRGYTAIVEFDEDANTFTGKVVNSNALVSFRGDCATELKRSFRDAVDAYLEACRESEIRMDPDTHPGSFQTGNNMLKLPCGKGNNQAIYP